MCEHNGCFTSDFDSTVKLLDGSLTLEWPGMALKKNVVQRLPAKATYQAG